MWVGGSLGNWARIIKGIYTSVRDSTMNRGNRYHEQVTNKVATSFKLLSYECGLSFGVTYCCNFLLRATYSKYTKYEI